MYDAMDSFLKVDTWHTGNPNDEERFYRALSQIVRDPDFSADAMGDYMRASKGVTDRDGSSPWEPVIDKLVSNAWAVRGYLKTNGE